MTFRERLQKLYFGTDKRARGFRYGLILFDVVTIAVFLMSAMIGAASWMVPLDLVIAGVLIVDFLARLYAEPSRRNHVLSLTMLADIVVIVSLLLPAVLDNLAFLRIARALRLLRSYHLLRDLRTDSPWFRQHEDVVQRALNLGVFIFIVTSVVFVTQHHGNAQIATYMDALYFTITTLTTTGFGDITLHGAGGRLLAVVIMVVGVSLFLRLLQAIFRPNKVRHECPDCGLLAHDADAVHCKHCGKVLHIESEAEA
ncbi:potassium channel family protein [soil metagenome]